MKNIYKKFILVGITSLSLIGCNIIDNQQSASIETKLQDIKLSNNIRNYSACIEDGRNFDRLAATKNEEAESLYNRSAKILSDCDLLIKGNPYMINEVERMQKLEGDIEHRIPVFEGLVKEEGGEEVRNRNRNRREKINNYFMLLYRLRCLQTILLFLCSSTRKRETNCFTILLEIAYFFQLAGNNTSLLFCLCRNRETLCFTNWHY